MTVRYVSLGFTVSFFFLLTQLRLTNKMCVWFVAFVKFLPLIDKYQNEKSMMTFEGTQTMGGTAIVEKLRAIGPCEYIKKTTEVQAALDGTLIEFQGISHRY